MAKEKVAGYIVKDATGRTLSRSLKWVHHRKGNLAKAWVHSLQTLLEGGPWAKEACMVRSAQWNPETTDTELTGPWDTFTFFLQDRAVSMATV